MEDSLQSVLTWTAVDQLYPHDEMEMQVVHKNLGICKSKVFVSYSHKDKRFLEALEVHLKSLVSLNTSIEIWSDRKIKGGERWRDKIQAAIAESKVAILLVSAHFLASDFIAYDELPPILERESQRDITVLCIVLSKCLFSDSSIGIYQAMNDADKPVCEMDYGKKERIWDATARRVRELLLENDASSETSGGDLLPGNSNNQH